MGPLFRPESVRSKASQVILTALMAGVVAHLSPTVHRLVTCRAQSVDSFLFRSDFSQRKHRMKSDISLHRYGNRDLSDRECQIIALVARGLKNRDIAKFLGITEAVIKNYLRRIYDKVGVWNRVELALWYEARQHAKPTSQKPDKSPSGEKQKKHDARQGEQPSRASRTSPSSNEDDDSAVADKKSA